MLTKKPQGRIKIKTEGLEKQTDIKGGGTETQRNWDKETHRGEGAQKPGQTYKQEGKTETQKLQNKLRREGRKEGNKKYTYSCWMSQSKC